MSVQNCSFIGNQSGYQGGALALMYQGTAQVDNCRFTGNSAPNLGGAVWIEYANVPPAGFTNCVFAANGSSFGGGLYSDLAGVMLTNCVLWGNSVGLEPRESAQIYGVAPELNYCCVEGWTGGLGGIGNLGDDPAFADPSGPDGIPGTSDDDLRLLDGSPCVDAGDPGFAAPGATDLDGHKRVWDGKGTGSAVVDMGAYELGSHAYGDLNCDGLIDKLDIDPFVQALVSPELYAASHPGCAAALGDVNADGVINPFDIDPLVLLLTGG